MDDCRELLPDWLRFVRGVVSSDDLSLNVSREILQKDRQIQATRKHLVRRLLATLKEMLDARPERYRAFWKEFGPVLKEGLILPGEDQDKLLELVLATSTVRPGEPTTLGAYIGRMKEGQDAIYYLTGPSRVAVERSPHLEALRAKGYEVLFFTDPVDELWLERPLECQGKALVSVARGGTPLGTEAERKQAEAECEEKEEEFKDLLLSLRSKLQDHVKDVRLSSRLVESPACLVGEAGDLSPQLRQLLQRVGQETPVVKRTLEVNPSHPVLLRLKAIHERDRNDPALGEYAELLYGQAILAEGGDLPDPAAFSRRVADLMARSLGG
jgi:molecular chaperone HtpG